MFVEIVHFCKFSHENFEFSYAYQIICKWSIFDFFSYSYPFNFLLLSHWLYTSSNSMLKMNGDSKQNSFSLDFRGIASSCFPLRITLARCLLYIAFTLRCVFSSPTISRYVGCDQMFLLQPLRWPSNFCL